MIKGNITAFNILVLFILSFILMSINNASALSSADNKLIAISNRIIDNNVQIKFIENYIDNVQASYKIKLQKLQSKRKLFTRSVAILYKIKLKPKELLLVETSNKQQILTSFVVLNYWMNHVVKSVNQIYLEVSSIRSTINKLNIAQKKLLSLNKNLAKYKNQINKLLAHNKKTTLNPKVLADIRTTLKYNSILASNNEVIFDNINTPVLNQQDKEKNTTFKKQNKGKMLWPTNGYIYSNYKATTGKSKKPASYINYYGIVLITMPSQAILSPADGEIIFNGIIDEYKQVIMIKHAPSFISIISGNFTVSSKLSSKVKKGEPIATVGNASQPIYFELDYNSSPTDPNSWLISKNKEK